jgi:hypothetical protein
MTTAQKAKNILDSIEGILGGSLPFADEPYMPETIKIALVVINESIAAVESIIGYQSHMWKEGEKQTHEYYQAIKKEIEKL